MGGSVFLLLSDLPYLKMVFSVYVERPIADHEGVWIIDTDTHHGWAGGPEPGLEPGAVARKDTGYRSTRSMS